MRRGKEAGFTRIEMIMVVAVLVVLAAVLTPYIIKHINDSRGSKARNEVQVIGGALTQFYKDTGTWPDRSADGKPVAYLYTGPENPQAAEIFKADPAVAPPVSVWTGPAAPLDNSLFTNGAGNSYPAKGELKWKGPYTGGPLPADPWGNPHLVNRAVSGPVWVLSAGMNRKIQTAASDNVVKGDDIGFRVR